MSTGVRINRFLAEAGFGSRRRVEALVREGRVSVDGVVRRDLGLRVDPENSRIEVDGRPARRPPAGRWLALHKPRGVVCSTVRQDRRRCLLDLLEPAPDPGRLFHVGRLDADSSGLLLLSDDGELAHALLHPRRPVWKRYEVQLDRPLEESAAEALRRGGMPLDGRPLAPARLVSRDDARHWVVELREGRNRQIRRMMLAQGCRVRRLHRVAFGPVELGALGEGEHRELSAREIEGLREAALPAGR